MNVSDSELRKFCFNLLQIKGIGHSSFRDILANFPNLYEAYFYITTNKKIEIGEKAYTYTESNLDIEKLGINFKLFYENDFPKNFENLKFKPSIIYFKGKWDIDKINRSISIVGTRSASQHGLKATLNISDKLAKLGLTIVSGGAYGIDSQAHLASIEAGGYTVAVLPSILYEPHTTIYKNILDSGGVIISDSISQSIVSGMFASRNKLIAAISSYSLIVEAPMKSGALITAKHASEFNKKVFAIPSNIDNLRGNGTNELIASGKAQAIIGVEDLITKLGLSGNTYNSTILVLDLTEDESSIYNAMLNGLYSVEDISAELNCHVSDILITLTNLELKNYISKTEEGFVKII